MAIGGIAAAFDGQHLGGVVGQPVAVEGLAVEGQHDDGAARDAAQLGQPPGQVGPLVHRDQRHRRVDGLVVQRQPLGDGVDGRRQVRGALRAHRGRGLDRDDMAVRRLVRAGARADVQDGAGVAERGVHPGGDARIGAALAAIALAVGGVVDVAGDGGCGHVFRSEWRIRGLQHDRSGAKRASSAERAPATGRAADERRAVGQSQREVDVAGKRSRGRAGRATDVPSSRSRPSTSLPKPARRRRATVASATRAHAAQPAVFAVGRRSPTPPRSAGARRAIEDDVAQFRTGQLEGEAHRAILPEGDRRGRRGLASLLVARRPRTAVLATATQNARPDTDSAPQVDRLSGLPSNRDAVRDFGGTNGRGIPRDRHDPFAIFSWRRE